MVRDHTYEWVNEGYLVYDSLILGLEQNGEAFDK